MPVARVDCAVVVHGDPTSVFDYVFDRSTHAAWQRDLLWRDEAVATTAPDQASWTEIRRFAAREVRVAVTVTERARPDRITFVSESEQLLTRGALEFRAEGPRTRILHHLELRGRGLNALLVPVIAHQARQSMQANLYRLTMRFASATAEH